MDKVRAVVRAGEGDDVLEPAIRSAGRRAFYQGAARAFSVTRAPRGDMASAYELSRLCDRCRKGDWCGKATLALARAVFGGERVRVQSAGPSDGVIMRASVLAGDPASSERGLCEMIRCGSPGDALVHARAMGEGSPGVVFDAASGACRDGRSRGYVEVLRGVYKMVGNDKACRESLIDSAVAYASGALKVAPPCGRESEDRLRLAALFSAPRARRARAKQRDPPRSGASEEKILELEGFASSGGVEVVKC